MANREWQRELEFSDDELADMGAELPGPQAAADLPLPGAPKRKKKSTLRVPVDVVPRRGSVPPVSAAARLANQVQRRPAPETASDRVVERALNGGSSGGPVSEPIPIGRAAKPPPAPAQPGDEIDLTIEMPVDLVAHAEAEPPLVATPPVAPPLAAPNEEAAEELDVEALEEEAAPVAEPEVEVDVEVEVEAELPERGDPTEPRGVPAMQDETALPLPPAMEAPPAPTELAAEESRPPRDEPPPPPPTPVRPPAPPPMSARADTARMPLPPARESRAPLPVDVIAAALAAPRPAPAEELEEEEELTGEELEVVSESSAAVAELAEAAKRAGVTAHVRATPPPTPMPAGDKAEKAPPPMPPALPQQATPRPAVAPTQAQAPAQPGAQVPASEVPETRPSAAVPPTQRRRRRAKAWFEEIFDEDYLRTLPFMTPRQTHREADFIEASLEVPKGGQILDLGCGYGRHALELAARGHNVVGMDLSLPLLIRAADEAQRRGLTVNFVHGDMRELTFEEQFDGAYSVLTTFGYFDDDTNRKVAQGVGRSLKPRGRFLVDVINRDYVVTDLPMRVWWEGDGCVVLEEVDFNYYTSRVVSRRSVVFEDGRQLEQEISIRAYSLHELGKVLHHAGFRVTEVSGSLATRGRYFGAASRELLVVAEKRPG